VKLVIQSGGALYYPFARQTSAHLIGDNVMEMHLQFGHGMMAHTRDLLAKWGGGTVILSPRDLTEEQLVRVAADVAKIGAEPLLDPQCYAKDADHQRLTQHSYWKAVHSYQSGAFTGGSGTAELLKELARLAKQMGVGSHLLPGLLAPVVNDDWFASQESIIEEAPTHFGGDPLYATVALSAEAMSHEEQVEAVVERVAGWAVEGVYLVAETPSPYLVDQPGWLTNLLLLASGMKLAGKRVIVGYCSHQMLCLAAANVDAIASGTWLNVRAFPPDKFYRADEDDISRRTTWYYCPASLSEYKIPFLDIALRNGVLDRMRPPKGFDAEYARPLFEGVQPTAINWGEQNAFRHYLTSLHSQAASANHGSFDASLDAHHALLDAAEGLARELQRNGVFAGDRDFLPIFDVNRSALITFEKSRGYRLRKTWPS
jgi:hypothetical protein